MNPRTIALSACLVAAGAARAGAQPEPTPGTVPGYPSPTEPAPLTIPMGTEEPAAPAPAEPAAPAEPPIKVITIGPDGRPVPEPPAEPSGYYYDDQSGQPAQDQTLTLHAGPTPQLHVVRSGDTLWDICWYYFNDPWQWPKIWSYNPQITNPHWIYPGDLVRLVPAGIEPPAPLPTDVESAPPPGPALGTEPAPARSFGVQLRQVAFLDKDALDTAILIDGAVEAKTLLSAGDLVYLTYPEDHPPQVGKSYSIYTIGHEVDHPRTHKKVGAYVHLLGTLKVQSVEKGKRATALITDSYTEINRGAHVGPLQRELRTVPPAKAEVDAQGTIVAMLTADQLIGTGEVVFVDLGAASGLKVGNRMYVVRRGDPMAERMHSSVGQDDRRFPAHALGEIVIVDVGKQVSIGLVTLAVQELGVGDLVLMRASD